MGNGQALYDDPATQFVADFIGDSAFLTGEIASTSGGDRASVRFPDGTLANDIRLHGSGASGPKAALMLRPERINLRAAQPADMASLAVTVSDVTFLGSSTVVHAETQWGEPLTVRLPFGHDLSLDTHRGQRQWVTWSVNAAHLFPA